VKRAFVKNWSRSKKRPFSKFEKNAEDPQVKARRNKSIGLLRSTATVVRLLVASQPSMCKKLAQKKSHIMEVQVNGGRAPEKVDFGLSLLETAITVDTVFKESEMVDCLGVSKGHGFEGVTHRWGTTKLPRKTHKGLRKVACIGAWHPARVGRTVGRAGQNGFHHRVELNKKIFRLGKSQEKDPANGKCTTDLTDKTITPLGGFVGYGTIKHDFLLLKGSVVGHRKRAITLRKPLHLTGSRAGSEKIELKLIDTTTKFGHGRFQTRDEKAKFVGPTKKSALRDAPAK
jgi:large subunit ribosomal protein L3e